MFKCPSLVCIFAPICFPEHIYSGILLHRGRINLRLQCNCTRISVYPPPIFFCVRLQMIILCYGMNIRCIVPHYPCTHPPRPLHAAPTTQHASCEDAVLGQFTSCLASLCTIPFIHPLFHSPSYATSFFIQFHPECCPSSSSSFLLLLPPPPSPSSFLLRTLLRALHCAVPFYIRRSVLIYTSIQYILRT